MRPVDAGGGATPAPACRRDRRVRLAAVIGEILAPAPVAGALLLIVAWRTAPTPGLALVWSALAVGLVTLGPFLFIVFWGRRVHADRHLGRREHRPAALLAASGFALAGMASLVATGARRELLALVATMGVGLLASLITSLVAKASIHAAVTAGAIVVLVVVFGAAMLLLSPLIVLTGWARVVEGHHSVPEVVAGIVLGAVVAGMFPMLR
jgi:hypothetical protein